MSEKNSILSKFNHYVPSLYEEVSALFDWDRIHLFFEFLKRENERGGFFSKGDSEKIFDRHVIDCLCFIYKLKEQGYVSRETNLADIGTGPGLPGFLFSCLIDPPIVTLIDSQRRKLALLEEEVSKGNLSDVRAKLTFHYERAEDVKLKFDIVTTRAVVPYPFIAEVVTNLVRKNGLLCPFLGQLKFDSLLEKKVLSYSGFKIEKEIEVTELSFLGKRHIKILQKDSDPKPGIPRPWKDIVQEIKQANG
jgi:16S rRNA (guanine527-N7)-methyltransferase